MRKQECSAAAAARARKLPCGGAGRQRGVGVEHQQRGRPVALQVPALGAAQLEGAEERAAARQQLLVVAQRRHEGGAAQQRAQRAEEVGLQQQVEGQRVDLVARRDQHVGAPARRQPHHGVAARPRRCRGRRRPQPGSGPSAAARRAGCRAPRCGRRPGWCTGSGGPARGP